MTIDLAKCEVAANGKTWSFPPIPPSVLEILTDGGLIPHLKKRIAAQGR